jgi:hypothetical protein
MMTMIRALVMAVIAASAFSGIASATEADVNDASAPAAALAKQTLTCELR